MDIRQIEGFFWTATLGSVSAAAKRLFISQSALSSRIISLEAEIKAPLFDRAGRNLVLTQRGAEFLDRAREVLDLMKTLRGGGDTAVVPRGTLRLGMVNTIAHTVLPKLVAALETRYPGLDIDVRVGVSHAIEDLLSRRDVDLGVLISPPRDRAIRSELLCRYELAWLASPRFPISRKRQALSDIARHRILTYERGTAVHRIVTGMFRQQGCWPVRMVSSNSVPAMIALAENDIGICVVPRPLAAVHVAAGRLRTVACRKALPKIDFYVATPVEPTNEIAKIAADLMFGIAGRR